MTIQEKQKQIVEEFSFLEEWMDKYEYLIELGKKLPPLEDSLRLEKNLIRGCQSRVWLAVSRENGKLVFKADSDALITKGIISLLVQVFSGHTPGEILESDFSFIQKIGLKEHLSPTRANGLLSMIEQIRLYALAANTEKTAENGK
ncbi:MAG TPA: SufE family protein [Bacteroidales bacterium]|jgi:cysteine desulfuration protein SufE|nr:SufE family protein [Bacteroidales bacterium]OQC56437.1 MAG: Cysteine desulfuration protein SufE [Bacteroidetes bacterium ADurb.Bin013]MBV6455483.1 Cysteine desulfuration protein SufE [Bacteroidales bacterium]MCZ2316335.1 SufE family protein [Bacteroidales bacterium]HNR27402.1 SufE family protein [Bacteroidales bacterium]